jgi:DNA-binding winged helix-turn-helix (wHTH) protein
MKRVWPNTFVEEGNLTQNISLLRKALGESPGGVQFIETVPRRGYRFVATQANRGAKSPHLSRAVDRRCFNSKHTSQSAATKELRFMRWPRLSSCWHHRTGLLHGRGKTESQQRFNR